MWDRVSAVSAVEGLEARIGKKSVIENATTIPRMSAGEAEAETAQAAFVCSRRAGKASQHWAGNWVCGW
jgi:hypothetical protein